MRVAALIHFAMPWRNAGSETVIHELLKAAALEGHDVTAYVTDCGTGPEVTYDGVRLVRIRNIVQAARRAAGTRPDVIVTHHQHAAYAIRTARLCNAKSVYLTHNDMDVNRRPLLMRPDLVIHNSQWVAESLNRYGVPRSSMIFHPPVTPDRHQCTPTGDYITLVNMNAHKGANLFYALAETEPDRQFLAVRGGHGQQVIRRLPNVTHHPHHADMRRVWEKTRVLLMPSVYESYGLVAQEAGICGIPTLATRTPGLVENIGPGGTYPVNVPDKPTDYNKTAAAIASDIDPWRDALAVLDNPTKYRAASDYALRRADEAVTATRDTLKVWTEWLAAVV